MARKSNLHLVNIVHSSPSKGEDHAKVKAMNDEHEPPILVPHADHGDPHCSGLIMASACGDQMELLCNECGTVIDTVPASEAQSTLLKMSMSEGVCSETCPHCGYQNVFTGVTSMIAFVCGQCGKGVDVKHSVQ